jgi:hypothetical protein
MKNLGWNDSKLQLNICNPALGPVAERVAAEIDAKHVQPPAIEMILANFLEAPDKSLRYSRTRDDYKMSRYCKFHLENVTKTIDRMGSAGYLLNQVGGFEQQRTIRATQKLLDLLAGSSLSQNQLGEVIILKGPDSSGQDEAEIEYPDTEDTCRMRTDLMAYNVMMSESEILDADGRCHSTHLVRIFNRGSFRTGGRFYRASYQRLGKNLRKQLTIDGCPIVECDYSALHPRLLYHWARLEAPETLYEVEGFDRDKLKRAFNIALNAEDREQAEFALAEKHFKGDLEPAGKYLDAAMARHPLIADKFFTGVGLRLQHLDSDIANDVLRAFVARKKPILVEHDSFLVKAEDEPMLIEAMTQAYRKGNPMNAEPVIMKQ